MSLKKYLVPLATLISAIPLAHASVQTQPSQSKLSGESINSTITVSGSNAQLIGSLFEYSKGAELHSLIVKPNESGVMLSYHRSHSSHSSHRSHYSSR